MVNKGFFVFKLKIKENGNWFEIVTNRLKFGYNLVTFSKNYFTI